MRIRGGRQGSSLPDRRANEERTRNFRRSHQVGQVVRGRLVGWEAQGMAWVRFDGQPLLARLPAETPIGALLTFVITALAPDIVLKLVPGKGGQAGAGELAAAFIAARTAFENAAAGPPPDPGLALLARVLARLSELNAMLPQGVRLAYPAWLAPGVRDLEMLIRRKKRDHGPDFLDLQLAGSLPACGAFRVQLLALGDDDSMRASVRVFAENKEALAPRAQAMAEAVARTAGSVEATWLGLEPLPRARRGGLLAELAVY